MNGFLHFLIEQASADRNFLLPAVVVPQLRGLPCGIRSRPPASSLPSCINILDGHGKARAGSTAAPLSPLQASLPPFESQAAARVACSRFRQAC